MPELAEGHNELYPQCHDVSCQCHVMCRNRESRLKVWLISLNIHIRLGGTTIGMAVSNLNGMILLLPISWLLSFVGSYTASHFVNQDSGKAILVPTVSIAASTHGSLTRYAKLRAAHAPGTLSMPLRISDPDMHHTCVMHVPWCMPGSLTCGFFWSRWRGKRSRIPGTCATRNIAYLVRSPWYSIRCSDNLFCKWPYHWPPQCLSRLVSTLILLRNLFTYTLQITLKWINNNSSRNSIRASITYHTNCIPNNCQVHHLP